MGRAPCCDENGLKKGPWTGEEDKKLVDYIQKHGHGSWRALPRLAGLNRCGKSCRLRWTNYLRPDIKRGKFTQDEEHTVIQLHSVLGNKWSAIASHLSGRTDNEIKNYWNTHLKKKLLQMGIDPVTHRPRTDLNLLANLPQLLIAAASPNPIINPLENAAQLAKLQLLHNIIQVLSTTTTNPNPNYLSSFNGITSTNPNSPTQNNHALDNSTFPFPYNGFSSFELSSPNLLGNGMDPITQMPTLIPVDDSPVGAQYSSLNQIEKDVSNPCSTTCTTTTNTTTALHAWNEEIVDDEASTSYWRDYFI